MIMGVQEPRIKVEPKYEYTDGEDAGKLASAYGLTPDPWQQMILNSWLGRDEFDKYTAFRCGVLVPRQNGKNAILEMRELYGMAVLGEKILHTAHEVKTARKAFLRLASFFENNREYPELAAMVLAVRRANGQEAILLKNGGSVEFSARSRGAARGFTVDVVVMDEVQELTDEQLEAIMPTISAAPLENPQIIMTGTPPNHNAPGEVYGRMRKTAHERTDNKLSWHEWSIENMEVDISNPEIWASCNPALGIRLDLSVIEGEFHQMSMDGFARERLAMWFDAEQEAKIINEQDWNECATDNPCTEGKTAYGVKFSPDGAIASVAVAVNNGEKVHVEIVHHKSMNEGITWLVDWLVPRLKTACTVAIDGLHWSGSLVEQLRENGVINKLAITLLSPKDIIAASSTLLNAITEHKITHYDQQALNKSALEAEKRLIGQSGGWAFGGVEDSTLIEAVALAHWAVLTSKRDPSRKQVIL